MEEYIDIWIFYNANFMLLFTPGSVPMEDNCSVVHISLIIGSVSWDKFEGDQI